MRLIKFWKISYNEIQNEVYEYIVVHDDNVTDSQIQQAVTTWAEQQTLQNGYTYGWDIVNRLNPVELSDLITEKATLVTRLLNEMRFLETLL